MKQYQTLTKRSGAFEIISPIRLSQPRSARDSRRKGRGAGRRCDFAIASSTRLRHRSARSSRRGGTPLCTKSWRSRSANVSRRDRFRLYGRAHSTTRPRIGSESQGYLMPGTSGSATVTSCGYVFSSSTISRFRSVRRENFRKYFVDPKATGNRASGWNFVNPYERIRRDRDALLHGDAGPVLRIFRDGTIEFTVPIEKLYWKSLSGCPEADGKEIWPFCLLEYPISVFRLASTIYREHALERLSSVLADLALFGLKDWTLRPYSPRSFGYKLHHPKLFVEENLLLPKPLTLERDEILDEADRCGFRLVEPGV